MAEAAPARPATEPLAAELLGIAALLKLQTFLSPAFPIGAFSYSHGLEWLIDSGLLKDEAGVRGWIADLMERGSVWNDAVLFAAAHRAAASGDEAGLSGIAELGEAMAGSRERHLETMAQGRAFLDAAAVAWPGASLATLRQHGAPYPVAVAAVAAGEAIAAEPALAAFLGAFAANLASVAVRLVPLGQSAGLRIVASLHPLAAATAGRAALSTLDDLGSATLRSEIASMRHETQYSRIFRT